MVIERFLLACNETGSQSLNAVNILVRHKDVVITVITSHAGIELIVDLAVQLVSQLSQLRDLPSQP